MTMTTDLDVKFDFPHQLSRKTNTWNIAPAHVSALVCAWCSTNISLADEEILSDELKTFVECRVCSRWVSKSTADLQIRSDNASFMNKNMVRNSVWYHATRVENWLEVVQREAPEFPGAEFLVHIGTRDSALARAADVGAKISRTMRPEWYMYEVRLKSGTEIWNNINVDANRNFPTMAKECLENKKYSSEVTRYVNRYEKPGSVSLLANAHSLDLVKFSIL